MIIKKIILKNWKNFRSVELDLRNRIFVIGANATGKSNFLDAFRFLRDVAKGQGGGLQQAVKERGGLSKIRCYGARSNPHIEMEIHLGTKESQTPEFTYRLGITQETTGHRRPIVKYEEAYVKFEKVLSRPDDNDKADPERRTETHLEQTSANKKFREVAVLLKSICYLHIVPQMIRVPEASIIPSNPDDPFGRSFLERVAKTSDKTRDARLKRIGNALQIIAPQLTHLKFKRDIKGQPHLEAIYAHWRPDAGQQNEIQFSD